MEAICDNILCNYRCHGDKLNTTGLCLTERTKEAQSDAPHSTKWRVSVDGNIPVSERKLVFPSRQTRVSVN